MSVSYRNATPPPLPWVNESFIDFWLTRLHPLWTLRRPLARLVARTAASTDAVTLELQPNRHFRGLRAGQHITLGVEVDGRLLSRSYSPTPMPNGHLAVTVKMVPDGKVSRYLGLEAAPGEVFALGQAFGEMTLAESVEQRLLLLAAGSGITPMRALLRQLDGAGMPMAVDLVYWARRREELCFVEEFQALAARHPSFNLQLALTRDPHEPADRVQGWSFDDMAALASARVLACGPAGFVAAVQARLQGRVAALQSEAFSLPVGEGAETGSVRVELRNSGRTLSLPRGVPLLEALEAQGIRPASACRMGICNTCVCGKLAGATRNALTGLLATEPSVPLKLCVNSASTDLILEL